uniref:Uncharacterized protein n=1 Tax=Setaria viridis TaxID=4556 RepID=A0A4U6V7K9_SETVI|nr:hypothetical protein SEVIR_3G101033v2 [Setaria viridis]
MSKSRRRRRRARRHVSVGSSPLPLASVRRRRGDRGGRESVPGAAQARGVYSLEPTYSWRLLVSSRLLCNRFALPRKSKGTEKEFRIAGVVWFFE